MASPLPNSRSHGRHWPLEQPETVVFSTGRFQGNRAARASKRPLRRTVSHSPAASNVDLGAR